MSAEMHLNEQPLGRILSVLAKGYLQLLRQKLKHLDIDRNYYALVLIEIHQGIITQQELALLLDSDKVSIVRIVDYLSEKGYIQRIRMSGDRRKHNLILTAKGKQAIPEIKKSFAELNALVLNGLEKSEVSKLSKVINKIKNNIHKTQV